MVRNLDSLITFLLDEIALCGEQGATPSDILTFLQDFYGQRSSSSSELGTNTPGFNSTEIGHGHGSETDVANLAVSTASQCIDQTFQAQVWQWLTAHPDIRLGAKAGNRLTSEEGKKDENNAGHRHHLVPPAAATNNTLVDGPPGVSTTSNLFETPVKSSTVLPSGTPAEGLDVVTVIQPLRIRVSEERIWLALTGHEIDWTRCPRLEFACLSVIANHRRSGIIQPKLIQLTGQDKRSLPRRTDTLAKKGYIQKTSIFVKKQRTSHLLLRRYANHRGPDVLTGPDKASTAEESEHTAQLAWTGDHLEIDALVRALFTELKQYSVITQADLKWKLGVRKDSWQARIFKTLVRKLEYIGCIRRVRAAPEAATGKRTYQCIKLIREPEDPDWRLTRDRSFVGGLALPKEAIGAADVDAESDDNLDEREDRLLSANQPYELDGPAGDRSNLRELGRVLPQWLPGKLPTNLIFDVVEASGIEGISTMSLKARSMGSFYQRPLEVTLDRLSEILNESQPPNLQHLAVIRDTAQSKKSYHFHYLTRGNFQQLVSNGRASWDSVAASSKDGKRKVNKSSKASKDLAEFDEYGFARLPDSQFVRKDGCATVSDSIVAAKVAEIVYTAHDPLLCRAGDGDYEIDWGYQGVGRGFVASRKGGDPRRYRQPIDPELPPKPRGRPRKYAKGKEPYLEGKRRRQKKLEEQMANSVAHGIDRQSQDGEPRTPTAYEARFEEEDPTSLIPEDHRFAVVINANHTAAARRQHLSTSTTAALPRNGNRSEREPEMERGVLGASSAARAAEINSSKSIQADYDNPSNSSRDLLAGTKFSPLSSETLCRTSTVPKSKPVKRFLLIDPPGSKYSRARRGRPKKAMVAVFHLARLQDLPWFGGGPAEATAGQPTVEGMTQAWESYAQAEVIPDSETHDNRRSHAAPATGNLKRLPSTANLGQPGDGSEPPVKRPRQGNDRLMRAPKAYGRSHEPVSAQTAPTADQVNPSYPIGAVSQAADGNAIMLDIRDKRALFPVNAANDGHRTVAIATAVDARPLNNTSVLNTSDPLSARGLFKSPEDRNVAEPERGQALQKQDAKMSSREKTSNLYERGSINFNRKRIILDLIDKLEGVFPGDRELWYPFSMTWMKENRESGKPDLRTLLGVQKALVDSGQLKAFKFCFTNSRGLQCEKKILARMHVNAKSPLVKDLESRIKAADGDLYIPPEAGVTAEAKKILDQGNGNPYGYGKIPRAKISKDSIAKVTLLRPEFSTDSTESRQTSRQRRKMAQDQAEVFKQREQEKQRKQQEMKSMRLNKELIRLSLYEQREAAKKIQQIADATYRLKTGYDGPPRVARLYGLNRLDPTRQIHRLYRRQANQQLGHSILPRPANPLLATGLETPTSLLSLFYKLQRTGLNTMEQRFDPNSGTFGTFYPTLGKRRKPVENFSMTKRIFGITLPTSLQEMIAQSGPRVPVGNGTSSDQVWQKFEYEVDAVCAWEKENELHVERKSPWIFINHTFSGPHARERTVQIDWKQAFTQVATIIDGSEDEAGDREAKRARTVDPIKHGVRLNVIKPLTTFKTRNLTAPPREVSRDSTVADMEALNGQAIAEDPVATGQPRRRRNRQSLEKMTEADAVKLLIAVTVVRALTGGINRNIDWVIVAQAFPEYDRAFLNKKWNTVGLKYRGQMEKLQMNFQESFIAAYESNVIPPIDYDNLVGYDWEWLVEWALNNVEIPDSQKLPNLPSTREKFDEAFEIRDDPEPTMSWRDEYFGLTVPFFKRGEIVGERSLSIPVASEIEQRSAEDDREMQVAKSWIRANILTSEDVYDPEAAKQKLGRLGEQRVDDALNEMCSDKIVMQANRGRIIPGRNYDITDTFLGSLKKSLDGDHFAKAAAFKVRIDEAFIKGETLTFSYHADDGEALALTNLVAALRIRLVPQQVPGNKFGLLDGSYRTRFMDKSLLHFDLSIQPTESYIVGNPLVPLPPPPQEHLEYGADGAVDQEGGLLLPTPVWFDIHENFVSVMWYKALAAVLTIVSMRSGVTFAELQRCVKPSLQRYELVLMLDWLVEAKAVRKITDGWVTEEWWWLLFPLPEELE